MALEVTLSQERSITSVPAQTFQTTTLTVQRIIDNYQEQKVIAVIEGVANHVILWEGADYVAIGQWTDTNVQNRLLELFDI